MSRLLVVEDDMEISNMINEFLTSEGFEIHQAYDGAEAIER